MIDLLTAGAGRPVSPECTLDSLALTSMAVIQVIAAMEQDLDVRAPALLFFECDTVGDLVRAVEESICSASFAPARPAIRPLPRRNQAPAEAS
jgi:hypothetical protein